MKISSNSILSISPHSKVIRRILLLVCFISMFSYSGYAATYYSRVANGNFASQATRTERIGSAIRTSNTVQTSNDVFNNLNGNNIRVTAAQIFDGIAVLFFLDLIKIMKTSTKTIIFLLS